MEPSVKVYLLDESRQRFFGDGPFRLLRLVEETGSLRSAATAMGMAYSKAIRLLSHAEQALGYPLTTRVIGGKSGGGSQLTPQGKELLEKYETYRQLCEQSNRDIFRRVFGGD